MYLNFRPACQLPQTRSAIITALSVQRYLDYLLITLIVYIGNVKTVECFIGIEKHPRTVEKKLATEATSVVRVAVNGKEENKCVHFLQNSLFVRTNNATNQNKVPYA